MNQSYTWADLWTTDAQFGFVCGVTAGVIGCLLLLVLMEILAWLAVGRKKPQPPTSERITRYGNAGGVTGQSWRRG